MSSDPVAEVRLHVRRPAPAKLAFEVAPAFSALSGFCFLPDGRRGRPPLESEAASSGIRIRSARPSSFFRPGAPADSFHLPPLQEAFSKIPHGGGPGKPPPQDGWHRPRPALWRWRKRGRRRSGHAGTSARFPRRSMGNIQGDFPAGGGRGGHAVAPPGVGSGGRARFTRLPPGTSTRTAVGEPRARRQRGGLCRLHGTPSQRKGHSLGPRRLGSQEVRRQAAPSYRHDNGVHRGSFRERVSGLPARAPATPAPTTNPRR